QVNWPAPAYFTAMILTAYWLSTRLRSKRKWKPWRGWFYGTIIFGLLIMPIAHDMTLAYPIVPRLNRVLAWIHESAAAHPNSRFLAWVERRTRNRQIDVRDIDPTAKLRGWRELGVHVSQELHTL